MKITKSELTKRRDEAHRLIKNCRLCPRRCGVDRTRGEMGFCRAGLKATAYSYRQYRGEEPPISGTKGSGAIFFSHCTMRCLYCQNFRFSQLGSGYEINPRILSNIMFSLEKTGCHNINLVTPSHYLPVILEAFLLTMDNPLAIPIVYNTSGYESRETLELLTGIVDIYLADMRYSNNKFSWLYSMAEDYVEASREAVSIMYSQVGRLKMDKDGIAKRGLIIRHLVLPNLLTNTDGVLGYIGSSLLKKTYISLMSQYIPLYRAKEAPEISGPLTQKEYEKACGLLSKYGIDHGWIQEFSGSM